jgi:hypothetical protein
LFGKFSVSPIVARIAKFDPYRATINIVVAGPITLSRMPGSISFMYELEACPIFLNNVMGTDKRPYVA